MPLLGVIESQVPPAVETEYERTAPDEDSVMGTGAGGGSPRT